jgi:hypothetical protein
LPSPRELIVGKWQVTIRRRREAQGVTFLVDVQRNGTFSLAVLNVPDDPDFQQYLGLRLTGVYQFRSEDVVDMELNAEGAGVSFQAIGTNKVAFVDRDLMILTSVVTDRKVDWRRLRD